VNDTRENNLARSRFHDGHRDAFARDSRINEAARVNVNVEARDIALKIAKNACTPAVPGNTPKQILTAGMGVHNAQQYRATNLEAPATELLETKRSRHDLVPPRHHDGDCGEAIEATLADYLSRSWSGSGPRFS
jgi:hypothetical protein